MFVGHLALALAAKRSAPRLSLGWLVAAVTTLDLLWPVFLLVGIERVRISSGATAFNPLIFNSYPWSHSLVMALVWGLLLAVLVRALRGTDSPTGLLVALVVSHWVLDLISHAPDMPLWPGNSPRFGLGLWQSIPATLSLEGALWVFGIALYQRGRRATSWQGPLAFWSLVGLCTLMWAAGPWSPPPPSVHALALFGLLGWILPPWAALADHFYRQLDPD